MIQTQSLDSLLPYQINMATKFFLDLPFNAIKVSFLLQVLLMVVMSIEYSDLTAISIKGCSDDDWARWRHDFYLFLFIFLNCLTTFSIKGCSSDWGVVIFIFFFLYF